VPLATALCKTFLLRMLNDSEQAKIQLSVVVPIEEEEEEEEEEKKKKSLNRYRIKQIFSEIVTIISVKYWDASTHSEVEDIRMTLCNKRSLCAEVTCTQEQKLFTSNRLMERFITFA
jgi:hypothetical protein